MGRPPLDPYAASVTLEVRLPSHLYVNLYTTALRTERRASNVVRELIAQWIEANRDTVTTVREVNGHAVFR